MTKAFPEVRTTSAKPLPHKAGGEGTVRTPILKPECDPPTMPFSRPLLYVALLIVAPGVVCKATAQPVVDVAGELQVEPSESRETDARPAGQLSDSRVDTPQDEPVDEGFTRVSDLPEPATEPPTEASAWTCPQSCEGTQAKPKHFDNLYRPEGHYRHPNTFRPFGDSVNAAFGTEIANGHAVRMVLYHYDFVDGGTSLSRRGHSELLDITGRLLRTPHPLVIQSTDDPEMDEARRHSVLAALTQLPFPFPGERVVIGRPSVYGLDGIDAIQVHQRLMGLTNLQTTGSGIGNRTGAASGGSTAR